MADLLSGLETALSFKPDISTKLKAHVTKIDEYMAKAALEAQRAQVYHSALPRQAQSMDRLPAESSGDIITLPDAITSTIPQTTSEILPVDDWTFELSPTQQMQLQNDLTTDWPFDFGNGVFDFLNGGNGSDTGLNWGQGDVDGGSS